MQNKELAVIMPDEWQVLTAQASALVDSGFLPQSINSVQKAVAIMTLGRELGVGAWAALTTINVIQGKPTISPQLMLALINRSGQLADILIDVDATRCVVTMRRAGRHAHTETFRMADAQTMQLAGKDNWKKQPQIMMKWRAVAACARVVFPDVILGLYTPEEMGADVVADEQGNMTVIGVSKPSSAPVIEPETVEVTEPSASVSGAGLPPRSGNGTAFSAPVASAHPIHERILNTETPLSEKDKAMLHPAEPQAPGDAPNHRQCDALVVTESRTARGYAFKVVNSPTRIVPLNLDVLAALDINGVNVTTLPRGEYALVPPWSVYADLDRDGWTVERIVTNIPVDVQSKIGTAP